MLRRVPIGFLLALLLAAAPASAQLTPSNGTSGGWTLIGGTQVTASARFGDVVYLGGSFTGIARRAPGVAGFDTATGAVAVDAALDAPASATAVAAAPDGGVYVAGPFAGAEGFPQPRLLRLGPDGRLDRAFRPQVADGTIDDVEVAAGGTVYVAGSFSSVGERARSGLAALDGRTGALKSWQPALPVGASVHQLVLGGGGAYVVGGFTSVGGAARAGVAQLSLSTGAATPWNAAPTGTVSSLALDGTTVYLGGSFTQIGGVARRALAAVRADDGALLPWAPAPDGNVALVRAAGGVVYAGGGFGAVGGKSRHRVAALDGVSGAATDWDAGIASDDAPTAIVPDGGRVYLGFATAPGRSVSVAGAPRCGLAAVDATSGVLDAAFDPQLSDLAARCGGGVEGVRGLARAGGRLWAAGRFEVANVRKRAGLAALDVAADAPTDWAPEASVPNPSGQSGVRALAVSADGATVYLGGQLTNLNGVSRLNAAAVAASGDASGPADVTAWNPAPNGRVNALALSASGNRIYLGGEFTSVGGTARPRLAWVSPTGGAASAWTPAPDGKVADLALAGDGTVFAAGAFAHAGSQARNGIAALDPASGGALAWDAAAPAGTALDSVALADGRVYVGGRLDGAIGGATRHGVAALDQATATALGWDPQVSGRSGRVQRVTPTPDGSVFLMGDFASVGGAAHSGAAQVGPDGTVTPWSPVALSSGPAPPPFQLVGDRVVAGGGFTNAGGRAQAGVAVFAPAVAPTAVAPPLVTSAGPLRVGATLTCSPGAYDGSGPFTRSYAWLRDGLPIPGETSTTYVTTFDDAGHEIVCDETAVNAAGTAAQASTALLVAPQPPAGLVAPAVGGEPWVGGVARCSTGLWRNVPTAYAYRWLLDGHVVLGASAQELSLGAADAGHVLACEVTASNGAGEAVALSEPLVVGPAPPFDLASPLVSGAPTVGAVLGCDPGTWEGATAYAFGWLRDGTAIVDARQAQLRLTSRDLGHLVACRVSASGPGGTRAADSAPLRVSAPPHSSARFAQDLVPGTPAAARLDVRRARLRGGALVLRIAVPFAGALNVQATTVRGRAHRGRSGHRRELVLGRASRRVAKAGVVTLRLAPGAAMRRALRAAGDGGLRVRLLVSARPLAGGAALLERARVTLHVSSLH